MVILLDNIEYNEKGYSFAVQHSEYGSKKITVPFDTVFNAYTYINFSAHNTIKEIKNNLYIELISGILYRKLEYQYTPSRLSKFKLPKEITKQIATMFMETANLMGLLEN